MLFLNNDPLFIVVKNRMAKTKNYFVVMVRIDGKVLSDEMVR